MIIIVNNYDSSIVGMIVEWLTCDAMERMLEKQHVKW